MRVIIIGNGILGLTTAYRLIQRDPTTTIALVGPANHRGCASLAAAAMFNSFCEVDDRTLINPIEKIKFLFNKSATSLWPKFISQLEADSNSTINHGFGTYLINNHATDSLEDQTFDAVVKALEHFNEPYAIANPSDIPCYKPAPQSRASRAIYIPVEGWINPLQLIQALKDVLEKSGRVNFVNDSCRSLTHSKCRIDSAVLAGGDVIRGDVYLLSTGATFSELLDNSRLDLQMPRIFYGVGCSILLKTDGATLPKCVRTPNRGGACGVYAAPQTTSMTLIGASNFISPVPEDGPRIASIHTLLAAAMEQINSDYYRSQLIKVNTGWRPTSEDTLPLLGSTSVENLLVATGTKRDGLHCSPLISTCLADLILEGKSTENIDVFQPERSPVRSYSRQDAVDTAVKHTLNAAYQHGFAPAKNRMVEDLEKYYRSDIESLHDKVGAVDWGIPPEMINMYRYGHIR
ncbi:MAG: dependent oxidoreductase [Planctomycetaceae bacterium]|nr:dependent oxidoreductase [Planctomycetaceae bacterium]